MRSTTRAAAAAAALLFPSFSTALWACDAVVDKNSYQFKELAGRHEVVWSRETPPTITNTTFSFNPCASLGKIPDTPPAEQCPHGTQICAVERDYNPDSNSTMIHRIIPISGDLLDGGKPGEITYSYLKTNPKNPDTKGQEGITVVLGGGKYAGVRQKAVVDFICDKDKTGLEGPGPVKEEDEGKKERRLSRRAEEKDAKKDEEPALKFISYDREEDEDVLRLEWRTKLACAGGADSGKSGRWGFFTWLVIIVFLGVAAYLIFGSWLNYNRYGARGWDLLPHSDTIRDFPYLLKDFLRKVLGTLQGGRGYRGGYSAV